MRTPTDPPGDLIMHTSLEHLGYAHGLGLSLTILPACLVVGVGISGSLLACLGVKSAKDTIEIGTQSRGTWVGISLQGTCRVRYLRIICLPAPETGQTPFIRRHVTDYTYGAPIIVSSLIVYSPKDRSYVLVGGGVWRSTALRGGRYQIHYNSSLSIYTYFYRCTTGFPVLNIGIQDVSNGLMVLWSYDIGTLMNLPSCGRVSWYTQCLPLSPC
jgi:hypothetical protein